MSNRTVYNIAGTVVGAILAAIAIFAGVQLLGNQEVPQENTSLVEYNA